MCSQPLLLLRVRSKLVLVKEVWLVCAAFFVQQRSVADQRLLEDAAFC